MASNNEDDFWNTSTSFGFNFDDDGDTSELFGDAVFSSVSAGSGGVVPVHTLVSKNCLDLILDDIKSVHDCNVPPVEKVIKDMINGHTYSLEVYKKFNDKLALLDRAIGTMHGNIVINVILFLKSTLTSDIFFHQLAKRKIAVKHYAHHLIVNSQFDELVDFYTAIGNNSQMKQLYYLIGHDIKSKDILYKRLEQFMGKHLQRVYSNDDKMELFENMQLLEWQMEKNGNAVSAIEQLAVFCKDEWEKNNNSNAVIDFRKRLKIDDFAYEWTTMNVLASMQMWPQLTALFVKLNWLTKRNVLKTVMPHEIFVYGLSRHHPPSDVLEHYLSCISDSNKGLYLAEKLNCHKFLIEHYISQMDRQALVSYKGKLASQSEELYLLESALQSTDKKWKN